LVTAAVPSIRRKNIPPRSPSFTTVSPHFRVLITDWETIFVACSSERFRSSETLRHKNSWRWKLKYLL